MRLDTADDSADDDIGDIDDDDVGVGDGGPGRARRFVQRGLAVTVALAVATVMVTFLAALGTHGAVSDVDIVVVGDPMPRAQPTPVAVLVVGPDRLVPWRGTINGVDVDVDGIASVVTNDGAIAVVGTATWHDEAVPVALQFPLSTTTLTTAITVTDTPRTLASPVAGAAVFPVDGLVPARGPASVVLVGDDGVTVVDVDIARDGRLPDGRLLAVGRGPVIVDVSDDDSGLTVTLSARRPSPLELSVVVAGRVLMLAKPKLSPSTPTTLRVAWPAWARMGDVVVVTTSTAIVPGTGGQAQRVTRVGGLTDADLLQVDGRAASAITDPRVRLALARRLIVEGGSPRVISPPFSTQRAARADDAAKLAAAARLRLRLACAALLLLCVALGVAWRVRPLSLAAAIVVVGGLLWGLDAVPGAVSSTQAADATSGSP